MQSRSIPVLALLLLSTAAVAGETKCEQTETRGTWVCWAPGGYLAYDWQNSGQLGYIVADHYDSLGYHQPWVITFVCNPRSDLAIDYLRVDIYYDYNAPNFYTESDLVYCEPSPPPPDVNVWTFRTWLVCFMTAPWWRCEDDPWHQEVRIEQ